MIPHSLQSSFFKKNLPSLHGFLEVFWKEGSLERTGKAPRESMRVCPKIWDALEWFLTQQSPRPQWRDLVCRSHLCGIVRVSLPFHLLVRLPSFQWNRTGAFPKRKWSESASMFFFALGGGVPDSLKVWLVDKLNWLNLGILPLRIVERRIMKSPSHE